MHIRENFLAHDDEADPERKAEIIDKAQKDADWVLQKVSKGLSTARLHNLKE